MAGRPPFARPDGRATQPPHQTAKANSTPRLGQKGRKMKGAFARLKAQRSKFKGEKPGYGRTGRYLA